MKNLYYFECKVNTPVKITVMAEDEQDAMKRLHEGAWHSCEANPRTWDFAIITHTGTITKGPKIN